MKGFLLFTVSLVILSLVSRGQTLVTGNVVDAATNEGLVGVTIKIKGQEQGTVTDGVGAFELLVSDHAGVLVFSFIGYVTQTITLTGNAKLTVALVPSEQQLQEVVIVGSRNANRTELNSLAPVDVLNIAALQKVVPQYDVNQLLSYVAPSFNANRQSSSDGSEHIDPASLRGLGPDQTLVLINGKRRHTTSLLNNQGTFGNGTVGTDLNAIPVAAIERIEVLRDGASAQYGSDAIAGVINVVLKKSTGLFNTNLASGITSRKDGQLYQINTNYGLALGKKGGYLNLTGEFYFRGRTNRTNNHNLIIFDQSAKGNYFAYAFANDSLQARQYDDSVLTVRGLKRDDFNFRIGDAQIKNATFFYNLSVPFGKDNHGEFYSFAGVSYRSGAGSGFRRLPSETSNVVDAIFPNGFQPHTNSSIWDRSLAVGVKYKTTNNWLLDLSNTFGNNRFDYEVSNTNNASLGSASPTSFKAGGHEFIQNTVNADVSRYFPTVASGLNLAFGSEFRVDNYRIRQGDEASWKNYAWVDNQDGTFSNPSGLAGGSQSFNGFTPGNAVNKSRTNTALYTDVDVDVIKNWTFEGAARVEHYSDFGSTLNGKLATRYVFNDVIALRAAISTGFRAPSLHQQYFSYVSTDILPSGTLGQSGFFRNDSDIAHAVRIPKLKQETSDNISFGVTINPASDFKLSVDAYQVNVYNRIVLTGSFGQDPYGETVPAIQDLLTPYGANTARFFTNAINTRTQGLDVVATYNVPVGAGKIDLSLAANFNKTEVGKKLNLPADLAGQDSVYFSPAEKALIERGNPRQKISFSIHYTVNKFSLLLRNTYFGQVTRNGFPFGVAQTQHGKVVTDLTLSYDIHSSLTITLGANNLLDVLPDKQVYANSYYGVFKYASVQQGSLGAFYFVRLNFKLPVNRS